MQIDLQYLTHATCGLMAILDQAMEQLGYVWEFCNGALGQLTTEGRQYYIRFTNQGSGRLVGYTYGRPFNRPCEARQSAIIQVLSFVDASGYIIYDINYNIWLQRHVDVVGLIDHGRDSDSDSNNDSVSDSNSG
jgi:hypothetical protein